MLLVNWNSWGDVLLFRRPGRVVVINKQRNRTSECGFRAACAKRESLVEMYTRVCERAACECQISWRVMNLGWRGWNGKRERERAESENIMEHITNTRWSAGAAHTKRRRFHVFLVISLPTRNNGGGGAVQTQRARRKSTCSRIIWGIMLQGGAGSGGSANAIKLEPHFAAAGVEFTCRQLELLGDLDFQCKSHCSQIQLVCRCAYSDGKWLWDMANRDT
jgi:hypothetical protein